MNIKNIFSIFLTIISSLICFYLFYLMFIFKDAADSSYYFNYLILSIIFLILSIITFFLPNEIKQNILLLIFTIILIFYILEFLLSFFNEKTKFEVYENLKKKNPDIKLNIVPHMYFGYFNKFTNIQKNFFPASGISDSLILDCNEDGFYSKFKTDRFGFNNDNQEWEKDIFEYVLVGDSFIQGACVKESDTIASNLRSKINNKNGLLNLGLGGNGPLLQYITLREYVHQKIKVKRILFFYYEGNDIDGLNNELTNPTLNKYVEDINFSQDLIKNQKTTDKLLNQILFNELKNIKSNNKNIILSQNTFVRFIKLSNLRKIIKSILKINNLKNIDIDFLINNWRIKSQYTNLEPRNIKPNNLKNVLELVANLSKENNSKLYFIYLPSYIRYIIEEDQNAYYYKDVVQIVNEMNISLIDLKKDMFDKSEDPLSFFPKIKPWHYNVKGYRVASKIIMEKISILESN